MKLSRRRFTLRAFIVILALFAVDFGAIAWVIRQHPPGPRVGNQVLRGDIWERVNPLPGIIAPVVFFVPLLLLFTMIYLYVPPRVDEILTVILILIVLVLLIVPALQHS